MDRLIFGMHHLNITQAGSLLDGKEHYSHPNAAIDLAGEDTGIDYWYNKESETYFYCSGYFGNRSTGNTRFFITCDKDGNKKKVLCADGKERVITLALTHSGKDYQLYKIYKPGDILYQEGTAGRATGNHIHLEVAEGSQKTKYWDAKMKVYRMMGEMDPRDAFFILDGYTTVVNTQSLVFKHCSSVKVTDIPSLPSYLYGVDISNHQSGIDISKLKNTDFVIVKATQGWNWTDPSFKNLYSQAVKSNKLLGTYYYAMPKNNNAKDDADYYVQEVNKIKGSSKPIFVLDWEEPPTDKVGWAYEWLERVASLTGATPLIYMNLNCVRSHDWSKVAAKYPLWLAQYPVAKYIYDYAKGNLNYSMTKYWSKPTVWQFTSHGHITGYSGNLDCDIFYGSREDWLRLAGQEEKLMDTKSIIKAHCNDFNVDNFTSKLNACGGYKSYVKSLGGVFSKYADFTGKVTKASELTEVGQYVCGLLSIWGVDYATGISGGGQGNWWKNDKPASEATDAFYPRSQDTGGKKNYLHEKIDDVLSDTANYKIGMVVDCETGVDMIRFKAGIYSGKESYDFRGMVQAGGKIITKMKDLQVGDIVQYYTGCTFPDKSPSKIVSTFGYIGHKNDNGGKGWMHVNIIGEVDLKNNTITTYDTGHAFTNSGEYKIKVSRDAKAPYPWCSDWVAVRPVNLIQDYDDIKQGWVKENGKWYFYSNGKKLTGWHKIKWSKGTDWFYFDKNGAMLTGPQYLEWKGKTDWYVFDNDGVMQTGTIKMEVKLDSSGRMMSLSTARLIK